jgi:AmmeMemoRadiSam system protein B
MQAVRAPAVAGSFYPAHPAELRGIVQHLLAHAPEGPCPKALIAPHAGYVYSGAVAAAGFRRTVRAPVARVVLLGPSHFARLRGVALPGAAAMRTPLGDVPVEQPDFPQDARAHAEEHSLEVELPFLQVALQSFTLVPLVVGDAAPDDVAHAIDSLWGGDETLIVVSSDLSHYLPYEDAQRADAATAKEILALGRVLADDACGAAAVNGLLLAAKRRKMRPELIELHNSGDSAGDKRRVVGYGAFAFYQR